MPTPTVGQTVTFNHDGEATPSPGSLKGIAALIVNGRVLVIDCHDTNPVVIGSPPHYYVNTGTRPGYSAPADVAVSAIVTAV